MDVSISGLFFWVVDLAASDGIRNLLLLFIAVEEIYE